MPVFRIVMLKEYSKVSIFAQFKGVFMEETISTTVEAPQEQTTPDVETSQTTETVEETSNVQPDTTQEPENVAEEATESVQADEPAKEPTKDWEQIAKANQASFTKVSQELAELKKQIADNKPKIVQEGKINPEFEQQYRFEVDNREFLAYDNLARQLGPEERAVVENLLTEAQRLYNPQNTRAYEAKLAQVKDYFRSDLVENIAKEKLQLLNQVKEKFDSALMADKQERAQRVAQTIETVPELNELVAPESQNFSQEVFNIVKAMFDYTGDIDVDSTTKAIQKIKELGVKEYIAKQQAEKVRAKANVPTGANLVQNNGDSIPSREELLNPETYRKAVKKFGMDKVDAVIMKG